MVWNYLSIQERFDGSGRTGRQKFIYDVVKLATLATSFSLKDLAGNKNQQQGDNIGPKLATFLGGKAF